MRFKKLLAVLFLLIPAAQVQAEDYDQQFSLSIDLLAEMALPPAGMASTAGLGGSAFFDWRPLPLLSIGTGFDYVNYFDTPSYQTVFWDLGLKFFPVPSDKGGEFYIQANLGLNTRLDVTDFSITGWPGHFHGGLGAGYRVFMGPSGALDLGAQYDYFTPLGAPLSAVGLKVGWVFLFGPSPIHDKEKNYSKPQAEDKPAPSSKPQPAAVVKSEASSDASVTPVASPGALNQAPGTSSKTKLGVKKTKNKKSAEPQPRPTAASSLSYIWVAGDQLESLAEAYFGRGNLYPLIVDANKHKLLSSAELVPGLKLAIPENVTEAQKEDARSKADKAEYKEWAKINKNP